MTNPALSLRQVENTNLTRFHFTPQRIRKKNNVQCVKSCEFIITQHHGDENFLKNIIWNGEENLEKMYVQQTEFALLQ